MMCCLPWVPYSAPQYQCQRRWVQAFSPSLNTNSWMSFALRWLLHLLKKAAFRLSIEGDCWSYKPGLCLIPKKCSASAVGNLRRDLCSRQTERVRHGKRESQACLGCGESYYGSSAQSCGVWASIWGWIWLAGWWLSLKVLELSWGF